MKVGRGMLATAVGATHCKHVSNSAVWSIAPSVQEGAERQEGGRS